MAQIKISEMPTASTVNLTDYVPIVQEGINKKTSVQNFVGNEAERIEAEKKRVEAEEARVAAERSRVQFEEIRKRDETTRTQNEENRASAEEARAQAEESRVTAEEGRVAAENTRVSNENERIKNENARKQNEEERIKNEEDRIKYGEYRKAAFTGGFLEENTTDFSGETSDYGVDLYKMVGKTEQVTTNGYQLFDASKLATKSQGGATVINNGDGSFTINGSGNLSSNCQVAFSLDTETSRKLVREGTITLNAGTTLPYMFVAFRNNSGSLKELNTLSKPISTATLTQEEINSDGFYMKIGFWGTKNYTIKTGTIKPVLYQDGDGTWEQYTGGQPAPNGDYAIEIENVNIKNILSTNSLMNESNIEIRGCFIQSNDIIADYDNTWNISKYIPIPSGVSKLNFKTKGIGPSICFYGKNKEYISGEAYDNRQIFIVDIPKDAFFMRISISDDYLANGYYCCSESEIFKSNTTQTSLTLAEGDVYEDGGITKTKGHITFDGSEDENWINGSVNDQSLIRFSIIIEGIKFNPSGKCNRFEWAITPTAQSTKEVIGGNPAENRLHVIIKRSRLETEDILGFKKWLQTHTLEIEYELATPTTKELKVPTIPSYYPYTNIFLDTKVKPQETIWRAKTASGLAIENKERLDQVQYDGLYVQGETYSGVASNKGIKLHSVKGKTSQKTTKGYQLFDASKLPTKSVSGVTVTNNNDGSFKISGTGKVSSTFSHQYTFTHDETLKILKSGKLYLKGKNVVYPKLDVGLINKTGIWASGKILSTNSKTTSIDILDEDLSPENGYRLHYQFYGGVDENIIPGTIKPVLYQDGDGTWEQYTGGQPAPNPDYAMEIENVEISEIESCGRNLLKLISTLEEKTINGVTFKPIFDGGYLKCITVNGTATKQVTYVLQNRYKFKNKSYVLQGSPQGGSNSKICLLCGIYNQSGKWINEKYDMGNGVTIDVDNTLIEFSILVRENQVCNNLIFYPMLRNAEDLDTTYEPPKNAIVETSLTLAQDDIYQNGITRARKQATFDGSSDEAWQYEYQSYRFYIPISDSLEYQGQRIPVICNRGVFKEGGLDIGTSFIGMNHYFYYTPGQDITTVENFKTWLSTHNLVVEYELATPTTEEFKVPTIPSYYPFTNVSTDNDLPTDIEWELLGNSDNSLEIESLEKRIAALEKQLIGG